MPVRGRAPARMACVPMARSDRKLILITSGLLVAAAAIFAGVLVFAAGTENPVAREQGPLYIGQRPDLMAKLDLGSPLYFANPFGGRGFWLDREGAALIALDVGLPGDTRCSVRWKGRADSYIDCDNRRVTKEQMARHPVDVIERGTQRGAVYVDLETRLLPPASSR